MITSSAGREDEEEKKTNSAVVKITKTEKGSVSAVKLMPGWHSHLRTI